jgi:hypothetical protein
VDWRPGRFATAARSLQGYARHSQKSITQFEAKIATRTKAALALGQARGVKLGGPELAEAREAAAASIKALADRHVTKGMTAIKKMSLPFARELAAKAHPPDFKNSVKARRCCLICWSSSKR